MRSNFARQNLNASLIHEARMIFQQLFGSGRVDNYYAMRAAEAQAKAKPSTSLKCNVCLGTKNKPQDAITIVNGQAVCMEHRSV
jgi:hypothetical protein